MRMRVFFFALLGLILLGASTRPARAQRQQDQIVTCSSDDGRRHYCSVDTRGGVSMGRQRSDSACVQGRSWGYDRRGIWVDRGCRADFVLNPSGSGSGWQSHLPFNDNGYNNNDGYNGNGYNNQGQTVTCSSDDGGRHYCSANIRRGVQLANQRSGSPCVQGRTWGYDQRGIWVDRGCRADFVVR